MQTSDRTPSDSVADPRAEGSDRSSGFETLDVLANVQRAGGREFALAVLRLQSTIGNAAVGRMVARSGGRRPLQRRVLTPNERKNDPSELKKAKRRVGALRRWLERLPDGELDATPMNKRRARWALLLHGTEPGFKIEPGVAARLTLLLDERSPQQAEKPAPKVREEASPEEPGSADFESATAEKKAQELESEFGFTKITTAREAWTLAEMTALAAALDLVPARDRPALGGAIVVKEPAPGEGDPPDFRGDWDTAGGYGDTSRMRLMQSVFDDEIVASVVLHEVGHAISSTQPNRIARLRRRVTDNRLATPRIIRSFVSKMFADHVINHMEAGNFGEYFAEAYAIWLIDRRILPAPLVRFFDELE